MTDLIRKPASSNNGGELTVEEYNNLQNLQNPTQMSDELATKLGFKQYTSGFTVTGTNYTLGRAVLIPYQMQGGEWRLKFNIFGTTSPTTDELTITISGITFKSGVNQGVASGGANLGAAIEFQIAEGGGGDIRMNEAGNGGAWPVSGDVELESKPTWAI